MIAKRIRLCRAAALCLQISKRTLRKWEQHAWFYANAELEWKIVPDHSAGKACAIQIVGERSGSGVSGWECFRSPRGSGLGADLDRSAGCLVLSSALWGSWLAGWWPCSSTKMCGRSKHSRAAKNIIARWRVEAADWQRFVATDPQWSSHANGRLNEFVPSDERRA